MRNASLAIMEAQVVHICAAKLNEDDLYVQIGTQLLLSKELERYDPERYGEMLQRGSVELTDDERLKIAPTDDPKDTGLRWWNEVAPRLYEQVSGPEKPHYHELVKVIPINLGGASAWSLA